MALTEWRTHAQSLLKTDTERAFQILDGAYDALRLSLGELHHETLDARMDRDTAQFLLQHPSASLRMKDTLDVCRSVRPLTSSHARALRQYAMVLEGSGRHRDAAATWHELHAVALLSEGCTSNDMVVAQNGMFRCLSQLHGRLVALIWRYGYVAALGGDRRRTGE